MDTCAYTKEMIEHVLSYVWFYLLNVVFLRFICIVACSCNKFTLTGLYSISLLSIHINYLSIVLQMDIELFPILGYYKQCCHQDITFIIKKILKITIISSTFPYPLSRRVKNFLLILVVDDIKVTTNRGAYLICHLDKAYVLY